MKKSIVKQISDTALESVKLVPFNELDDLRRGFGLAFTSIHSTDFRLAKDSELNDVVLRYFDSIYRLCDSCGTDLLHLSDDRQDCVDSALVKILIQTQDTIKEGLIKYKKIKFENEGGN